MNYFKNKVPLFCEIKTITAVSKYLNYGHYQARNAIYCIYRKATANVMQFATNIAANSARIINILHMKQRIRETVESVTPMFFIMCDS